ncbi:MAG: hypothetical protein ACD_71C00222G0009 [uncultured bacterium (gcode 4)]|uniref:Uncharacterized protein n=1 Tax=uncultured bacterium (gcode 4) TaxID=1234023 RepID=K1YMI9_9BACT|nr:MAG: hypothetical protein ACD_71C00222G0009 [uncultured bacterium (gcode 4)]
MLNKIWHQFVDIIPSILDEGVLYISLKYKVWVHLCFCGCKEKVVTTLTPDSWYMIYDGETVSIRPSVGSFNIKCLSHYYITNNNIIWLDNIPQPKKKEKKSWINTLKFWR